MKGFIYRFVVTAVAALWCGSVAVFAIDRNDSRYAAVGYCAYYAADLKDTPAPAGYKPFYISHFGRHGSRYDTSTSNMKLVASWLREASQMGILTAEGEDLLRQEELLYSLTHGHKGELTERGEREHREIAQRMTARFSPVFRQKDRREIYAISTTAQRCQKSMANATGVIAKEDPELEIRTAKGDSIQHWLAAKTCVDAIRKDGKAKMDSVRRATSRPSGVIERIFTDTTAAKHLFADNSRKFTATLFTTASAASNIECDSLDIFAFYTPEALEAEHRIASIYAYMSYADSKEYGVRRLESAVPLLERVVRDADNAIAGNSRAADLRYGHDTGFIPFAAIAGAGKAAVCVPFTEGCDTWGSEPRVMMMAANIQFIFYKNKKGNVLVKTLLNEREVPIEGLKPVKGPYYKWEDFRNLCNEKMKKYEKD